MPRRIAIVGAGFCGSVLAAHLLRQAVNSATTIHLFERGSVMGRGVAYAARDWPYLLNVPAGRLSADSREPLQFLHFAQRTLPNADAEDFLPRELYGSYIQEVLQRAESEASPQIRLTRTFAEITRIAPRANGAEFQLELANRDSLIADQVVLAVGNPPSPVLPWAREVQGHPAFYADPWIRPRTLSPDKVMVIIGSGLTMADVALSSVDSNDRAPRIISISRHGMLHLPQSVFRPETVHDDLTQALARASSARELLTTVREAARDSAERGGDWREVITLVRNAAPGIWQRLPTAERRRFLRHLRVYWDVHRHRLPAHMSSRLDSLRRRGRLEVNAGRIVEVAVIGSRLRISWRCRGSERMRTVDADMVVNATGPAYSVGQTPDPLLKSLHDSGQIAEDELKLGLRTAANGACVAADGTGSSRLYYLGPMLRAGLWEATAATELRDHAEQMARHLMAD